LLDVILSRYQLSVDGIHGVHHWGRVLENGRRLATVTGADLRVVELFAILHDSCRQSDGRDPDHGPRAAARDPATIRWAGSRAARRQVPVVCAAEWGLGRKG
jgi:hypothetical protein